MPGITADEVSHDGGSYQDEFLNKEWRRNFSLRFFNLV